MGFRQKATGFGRELSVRPSVRLSSRGSTERSTELTPKSRRTSEVSRRGPNGKRQKGRKIGVPH